MECYYRGATIYTVTVEGHLWCDLRESVGSSTCDIFSFPFDWNPHYERYILLKTPLELVEWLQGYEQLKGLRTIENNRNAFLFLAVSHTQCCQLPSLYQALLRSYPPDKQSASKGKISLFLLHTWRHQHQLVGNQLLRSPHSLNTLSRLLVASTSIRIEFCVQSSHIQSLPSLNWNVPDITISC